jgi:predicted ATP-grasp superfamily ATP-dependent carboligase
MLTVDHVPDLSDPVLVTSFSGWVDAGYAGATAIAVLTAQLTSPEPVATVDLAELSDLQATRPTVRLVDGGLREIEWPSISVTAGRAGRDVVVIEGPEPSLRWPDVARAFADFAERLGVREAYSVAGMPALASHRRPVRVLATATARSVAQEVGALREDYAGPTGFQTVLQHMLGEGGVRAVGLWAQVPQYVSASSSPAAATALLARLHELTGVTVDLRALDEQSSEWVRKIDEGLEQRPDVAQLVEQLEAQLDRAMPSGDELVSEIERFLRSQGES